MNLILIVSIQGNEDFHNFGKKIQSLEPIYVLILFSARKIGVLNSTSLKFKA